MISFNIYSLYNVLWKKILLPRILKLILYNNISNVYLNERTVKAKENHLIHNNHEKARK